MHVARIALTAVLAIILAGAGIPNIINSPSAQSRAEHLGVAPTLNRAIGILQLAATAGLLVGFAVRPLAIAAAAGVVLLMIGAVVSHVRVKDRVHAMIPALVVGLLAVAVFILLLSQVS